MIHTPDCWTIIKLSGKDVPNTKEQNEKIGNSLRGIKKQKVICSHCLKEGGDQAMRRWHFDNCKFKRG